MKVHTTAYEKASLRGITVCYLNNYEVTQSIVAELKKLEDARYQKEIGRAAASQKLTKFNQENLKFASFRSHIVIVFIF